MHGLMDDEIFHSRSIPEVINIGAFLRKIGRATCVVIQGEGFFR